MKAVIVDLKGKDAIVLSKDGQFIKMRNTKLLKVGSEIDLPEKSVRRLNDFMMKGIAAAAVFAFTLGFGVFSYSMPYSYVNVDINPSMEIVANIYDRVLKVEAINKDAEILLENHDFRNKYIDYAVEEIIKDAASKGYIKKDVSDAVMLTVSSKDEKKSEKVEKRLQETAKIEITKDEVQTDLIVESTTVDRHDEARKLDISPGKLVLIEKLQDVAPETKVEDYKDSPVKEIMNAINEKKDEIRVENKTNSEQKKDSDIKSNNKDNKNQQNNKTDKNDKNDKTSNNKNDKTADNSKDDKKTINQNGKQENKDATSNKPNENDLKDKDNKNLSKDNGRNK